MHKTRQGSQMENNEQGNISIPCICDKNSYKILQNNMKNIIKYNLINIILTLHII